MPRKRRRVRLSEYEIPAIDPADRNAVEDHALVRHVLVDFDEVAVLSDETRERLVAELVASICFARGGIKAGKRHVSDKALGKHIFLSDVRRAMERAGLPVKRWRKHDHGGGESLYYRMAHALAEAARSAAARTAPARKFPSLHLPQDLKPLAMQADKYQYGVMSPAMQAAQAAELAARGRKRLGELAVRLKTPLATWQQRLGDLSARLKTPLATWRQRLDRLTVRLHAAAP